MSRSQLALAKYNMAATELANHVKWCIQHNGAMIDDETVNKLNEFMMAHNTIKDLIDELEKSTRKFDN